MPELTMHCALQEVVYLAQFRWNTRLSLSTLADGTGLQVTTITRLIHHQSGRIAIPTLGALCSYFWCLPSELLVVTETSPVHVAPTVVRRPHQPAGRVVPIPIHIVIGDALKNHDRAVVARAIGRAESVVHALIHNHIHQISLETLARVCQFLDVGVDALIHATLPANPDEAT